MNYEQPERLKALAQQFVLGTMSRRARRRFGHLIDQSPAAEAAVLAVEQDLADLSLSVEPVQPSALVWQRIKRQLHAKAVPASTKRSWSSVAAGLLAVALLGTSISLWNALQKPAEVIVETIVLDPAVSIVANEQGQPLWYVQLIDNARAEISVQTNPTAQPDNDYQLWLIREDGSPVSVGLLPQSGSRTLTLSADVRQGLTNGRVLAVSLEPEGGSPEPVPTGPVLYTAAIVGG